MREQLDQFRAELVELAYRLDCRGRADAADVAAMAAARLGEMLQAPSEKNCTSGPECTAPIVG
ncbi:MAG: hypothetical protein H3C27_12385 [Opitutaceae bacterium]|nr:hypothetical protein [Opitutaceae bacterium]